MTFFATDGTLTDMATVMDLLGAGPVSSAQPWLRQP